MIIAIMVIIAIPVIIEIIVIIAIIIIVITIIIVLKAATASLLRKAPPHAVMDVQRRQHPLSLHKAPWR